MWAVNELQDFRESGKTIEVWSDIALNDSFWALREAAIKQLGDLKDSQYRNSFRNALNDPNSKVRAAALEALGKSGEEDIIKLCRKKFDADESYLVRAEALKQIGIHASRSQLKFLGEARSMKSPRNVVERAAEGAIQMIKSRETEKPGKMDPGKMEPIAWWNFNACDVRTLSDGVSDVNDSILGNFRLSPRRTS